MDEKIRAYMDLDMAYGSKVIPKKQTITFFSRKSGMPQVWKLDENHKPVLYIESEDTIINVFYSPQGDKAIIAQDNNGNEKQQYFLVTEDGTKKEPLVYSPEHFHYFGGWSPDGQCIAYSSNRRHPGYFDIFLHNIETNEVKTAFTYDGNCTPVTWLKDGKHLLIDLPETSDDQRIFKLNVETGELTRIGKEDVEARYQSFALTKDGHGGYVVTDLNEDNLYIGKFSFEQPEQIEKVIETPTWDVEEIKLSPNEEKLAYTLNEAGYFKLVILDVATGEQEEVTDIPKGVIQSIAWLNDEAFVFSANTPTLPGDLFKYSLTTKEVERLTYISHSDELTPHLVEPKLCTFKSFDGLDVPYFYYAKDDQPNKPAVLYVHGGPSVQTRAEFNYYIQYLVNQGFAVAAPNVRGSNGYGRKYLSLDNVRNRMDAVKDLAWLVEDLIKTHQVDRDRIGIMGRSYGGFMTLAAITHYPDLWAAAVDIVGISSFKTFMQTTGEWRRKLRGSEYGTIENDLEFFEEIDPLNHAHKIKAPLLIFHGLNDSRVPVTESIQMTMALKERRQDVKLTIFDDEGHFTEKKHNHFTMNGNIVKFFEEKLS